MFDVVNNGEYYKMAYFDGDDYADYDRFIELCMSYASFLQSDPEKALELEAEIDQLEIYHPYYNEEKAELSMLGNNYERAEELTRDFPSLYPDEERLLVCRLRSLMMLRRLD